MNASRFDEQSYYEILEISPRAAQHEIHIAYERAKRAYSMDSPALYTMFTPQEAKDLLALIEEAYAVLSSQPRREEYDLKLVRTTSTPEVKSKSTTDSAKPSITVTTHPESTPEGFARTRFGAYEIDQALEEEMRSIPEEIDGNFLQRVRLYKRIPMDQLAEHTKISKTYWCAIEAVDHKALPAPVFVRGFVAQLARILGMNDKTVADAYMRHFKKPRPD